MPRKLSRMGYPYQAMASGLWASSAWVFVGAGLGSVLRHWITFWSQSRFEVTFVGTFAANVLGSLAMGALLAWAGETAETPGWRPFLATGLLGGFTTFSAFSGELLELLQGRHYELAFLYALLSVALCLLAAWAGFAVARALLA
jgi:fluoride exporter